MSDDSATISGPETWPASSEPPTFDVFDNGHPFWMVEASTRPELMDPSFEGERADDNYYFGGAAPGAFAHGPLWTMPQDAWDRLGVSGRIYYRIFTSESDQGFVDDTVSVDDPSGDGLPFVDVGVETGAVEEDAETSTGADADLEPLWRYLGITEEEFQAEASRYLSRMGELLTFHGVTQSADEVDETSLRAAVSQFQQQRGMAVDGLAGEDTLWELNASWALANQLDLVRLEMDAWTPPGVATHDDDQHGYSSARLRSDCADSVAQWRGELNAAGVPLTTSGATRSLDAVVRTGRSPTSIHYSAAAIDLATPSGMARMGAVRAEELAYVVTEESGRWRVWARSEAGEELALDIVEWSGGATTARRVEGRFLDVTAAAARHGLAPIGPRSTFPGDYQSAEWWHFQSSDVLVPWVSQFGSEILRLRGTTESDLQSRAALWEVRKRIFHKKSHGWW